MQQEIIAHLQSQLPAGVPSHILAQMFLKINNPDQAIAHRLIAAIIGSDHRCEFRDDGAWYACAVATGPHQTLLDEVPWIGVFALSDPTRVDRRIWHLCAWRILPGPKLLWGRWLIDPATLSHEEQERLISLYDGPYDANTREAHIADLAMLLDAGAPVFISSYQQLLVQNLFAAQGEELTDDSMLCSQLMRSANVPVPKSIEFAVCYQAVFGRSPGVSHVGKYGELFGTLILQLLELVKKSGIATLQELDEVDEQSLAVDFSHKQFSLNDIMALPEKPGVYAFKNNKNDYIYIGKAKKLRRRLLQYFRATDESPEKITRIRSESYALTTHLCGSELEAIIFEHRLIRKYSPELNCQRGINERRGAYTAIQDSIVLVPHTEQGKGMSLWFRKDQKIATKVFDTSFPFAQFFCSDLEKFFFSEKLAPEVTDFPEQEIIFRWIKKNADTLVIIPVDRASSAEELYDLMKAYWPEVRM